jgi:hypothetical protein
MDSVSLGFVTGASLPETISGLTTFGGPVVFSVYAKDRPDCFTSVELVLEECRTIPCALFDLVGIPGTCTSDTTFTLTAALVYEGFTRDSVDVWIDDVFAGSFHTDSLPVTIEDIEWGGGVDTMSLRVCQTGDPTCCDTTAFVAPYCGCDVVSVSAIPLGYCNPDAISFPVAVDIDWLGDVSSFTVYAGNELLAVLDAASLPDTVLSFPVPLTEFAEIRVCGDNDSTCCATQSFIPANCDTSLCVIADITVDTFQCTGANTFSAWIDYSIEGFDGPINYYANGEFLGDYPQFHPLLLVNIPESDDSIVLRLCNASNPGCCAEFTFQGMQCADTPCLISELEGTVIGPDTSGAFQVLLDFDYENVGAAFTVSGNGNQYGVFTYNNVPLTISDLQCDTLTEWEFVVQDLQNIGCLDVVNIGLVDCDTMTSVFPEPAEALPLLIYYGRSETYFVVPDGAKEMRLWTSDGRLVARADDLIPGALVPLAEHMPGPGFYFVHVWSADKSYAGKVVGFR